MPCFATMALKARIIPVTVPSSPSNRRKWNRSPTIPPSWIEPGGLVLTRLFHGRFCIRRSRIRSPCSAPNPREPHWRRASVLRDATGLHRLVDLPLRDQLIQLLDDRIPA